MVIRKAIGLASAIWKHLKRRRLIKEKKKVYRDIVARKDSTHFLSLGGFRNFIRNGGLQSRPRTGYRLAPGSCVLCGGGEG